MHILDAIASISTCDSATKLDPRSVSDQLHADRAGQFLYGPSERISNEYPQVTKDFISRLGLNGDNFSFIAKGVHGSVYGNDDLVLRLETRAFESLKSNQVKSVPETLAAKIYAEGSHHGVNYKLCERLYGEPALADIIPFLFKARDSGIVYSDPKSENFGYGQDQVLRVLDHEHFETLEASNQNFKRSLTKALTYNPAVYPLITSHGNDTYIIFNPTARQVDQPRRLLEEVRRVGVHTGDIEVLDEPTLVRIHHVNRSHIALADTITDMLRPARKSL